MDDHNKPIGIRDLYPHLSDAELAVAEANLRRYVAVIVRIYERLKSEGKSWPAPDFRADLTASRKHRRIPDERSNSLKSAINQPKST